MGRPSLAGPLIGVKFDDRWVGWCDGFWSGDKELVAHARRAAINGAWHYVLGALCQADDETLQGRLVALHAYDDGRAVITDAPVEVLEQLREHTGSGEGS